MPGVVPTWMWSRFPHCVLLQHAPSTGAVARCDRRRLVSEEDTMLRVAVGERCDGSRAVESPVDLQRYVTGEFARRRALLRLSIGLYETVDHELPLAERGRPAERQPECTADSCRGLE